MVQLSLFDSPKKSSRKPTRARRTDTASSPEAAERAEANGTIGRHAVIILETLREHPDSTSAELAQWCELDRVQIARRLPEMAREDEPLVTCDMSGRKCTVKGTRAVTWRAVK